MSAASDDERDRIRERLHCLNEKQNSIEAEKEALRTAIAIDTAADTDRDPKDREIERSIASIVD
jgi:hypothetical protein